MGFPMVKHPRFHRFPVRLDPPVGLDSVVLNRFFSADPWIGALYLEARGKRARTAQSTGFSTGRAGGVEH